LANTQPELPQAASATVTPRQQVDTSLVLKNTIKIVERCDSSTATRAAVTSHNR